MSTITTTGAIAKIIFRDITARTTLMIVSRIPVNMVEPALTLIGNSPLTHVYVLLATLGTTAKLLVIILYVFFRIINMRQNDKIHLYHAWTRSILNALIILTVTDRRSSFSNFTMDIYDSFDFSV